MQYIVCLMKDSFAIMMPEGGSAVGCTGLFAQTWSDRQPVKLPPCPCTPELTFHLSSFDPSPCYSGNQLTQPSKTLCTEVVQSQPLPLTQVSPHAVHLLAAPQVELSLSLLSSQKVRWGTLLIMQTSLALLHGGRTLLLSPSSLWLCARSHGSVL